jgi:NAD(P)H-hydrate epimerase
LLKEGTMNSQPANSQLPKLPARRPDSHKGDFGRAVLVGGSVGMSGAIGLAGMAALRSGAGLVRLAVPEKCLATVASFEPSYMTTPLECDAEGRLAAAARSHIGELAEQATVMACGPGLGQSPEITELVAWMYTHLPMPLVIDADGLNALSARHDVLDQPGGLRVLTPHPGEFGRLAGISTRKVQDARQELASQFAARHGVVVVLKGQHTVVSDGQQTALNTTGNSGMATGGTGDVLTGVITALWAQRLSPYDAARLGVHLHGLAGDLAAAELGQVSLVASDLVRYLPMAFQSFARGQ